MIGILESTRAEVYDADFQAWIDYCTVQGYYLPSSTQLNKASSLIIRDKANGTWQKRDTCFLFAWNDLQMADASLVCIKRLLKATVHGGMTYTLQGWKGNGTNGYIDIHFNPLNNGVNYGNRNASRSFLLYDEGAGSGVTIFGELTGSNNISITGSGNANGQRINSPSSFTPPPDISGIGYKSVNKVDLNTVNITNNSVETVHSSQSAVLYNTDFILFRRQGAYGDVGLSSFSLGADFTFAQNQNIRTSLNTYLTEIGLTAIA